jgi:sulfate-transporting ATPase
MIFDNVTISNGTTGLAVGDPAIFGLDISAIFYPRRYAVFALVIVVIVGVAVLNLRRSAAGRRMLAVRGNEAAAASIGVSVARTKLLAFVVAAIIAGTGGVLIAFTNLNVVMGDPGGRFDPTYSINAIAEATVGGIGYVSGPLVGTLMEPGAVMNQVLLFITSGSWLNLIGGLLLLLTVVTAPSGIAANVQRSILTLAARFPRRAGKGEQVSGVGDVQVTRVGPAELAVRGLSIAFGGNKVLESVDLDIRHGRVLGVIGPNGAGKTTLVEAITGYNRPDAGTVTLDGKNVLSMPPASRARAGIARSFQALELFEDLSVLDNLLVASDQSRWFRTLIAGVYPGKPRLGSAASAAVATFGLADRLHDSPGDLSYGARRLLAIARALATRPRVLLLDEPAAGLGGGERADLRKLVRAIAEDWGIAVLIIEHDVELVLGVSDEIVAMDFGRVIARGAPADVRNNPAVIAAYLGTDDPSPGGTQDDGAREEQSA